MQPGLLSLSSEGGDELEMGREKSRRRSAVRGGDAVDALDNAPVLDEATESVVGSLRGVFREGLIRGGAGGVMVE